MAEVSRSLNRKTSDHLAESTLQANELLWGILHALDRIRGSQSYLFPTLLEQCKNVLGFDCTITTGNYLPPLPVPSDSDQPFLNGDNAWAHDLPDDIDDARVPVSAAASVPVGSHLALQDGPHMPLA